MAGILCSAIQTVQGCFSARGSPKSPQTFWGRGERLGYLQWASNAEPASITGTQIIFSIDNRAGTADYSLAKKNYPVLSELQILFRATLLPLAIIVLPLCRPIFHSSGPGFHGPRHPGRRP